MKSINIWKVTLHSDTPMTGAPWSTEHYAARTIEEAIRKALKDTRDAGLKRVKVSSAEFVCEAVG